MSYRPLLVDLKRLKHYACQYRALFLGGNKISGTYKSFRFEMLSIQYKWLSNLIIIAVWNASCDTVLQVKDDFATTRFCDWCFCSMFKTCYIE